MTQVRDNQGMAACSHPQPGRRAQLPVEMLCPVRLLDRSDISGRGPCLSELGVLLSWRLVAPDPHVDPAGLGLERRDIHPEARAGNFVDPLH